MMTHGLTAAFIGLVAIALVNSATSTSGAAATGTNKSEKINSKLLEISKNYDECLLNSLYHFLYPQTYPPTDAKSMAESCAKRSAAFKCLKDKLKTSSDTAILKRGIKNFIAQQQKMHKKFCTNIESEQTKEFLRDMKCLMDKKLAKFNEVEAVQANSGLEILRRNYSDPAIELKYVCCAIAQLKKGLLDSAGPECESARPNLEMLIQDDVTLVCEDDDKLLAQVCPKLEPLKVKKTYDIKNNPSSSAVYIYLFTTLGEPEPGRK